MLAKHLSFILEFLTCIGATCLVHLMFQFSWWDALGGVMLLELAIRLLHDFTPPSVR